MYSNQEISNQLDQIDEQYYADHEIEYFDLLINTQKKIL